MKNHLEFLAERIDKLEEVIKNKRKEHNGKGMVEKRS